MSRRLLRLPPADDDLVRLVESVCNGDITSGDRERLESLLADDRNAKLYYVACLDLHAHMQWMSRGCEREFDDVFSDQADVALQVAEGEAWTDDALRQEVKPESPSTSQLTPSGILHSSSDIPSLPPIVLDLSPGPQTPSVFAPGGMLFSYGVAALVVAVGLLIGWVRQVAYYDDLAQTDTAPAATARTEVRPEPAREPELHFVGRITGMVDCQWADAATEAAAGSFVAVGRRYALAAGLLEITYDTGAKVILQGPCSYGVDAGDGGFLALGKLTAKVEKKVASDQRPVASEAATTRHSPLFTVRTPTSIVTDLGTEFAVEVDKSGASRAHVFQGKVEVRPGDRTRSGDPPILLETNQSASVAVGRDGVASVRRESGAPSPGAFARTMPKRVRIKLFKTGAGLKEGDLDPHWQVVARSDDPNFKPQPAMVIRSDSRHTVQNYELQAMWPISLSNGPVPNGVRYTFRTTFDMTGLLLNSATIRGSILADDAVAAIRLNGRDLIDPKVDVSQAQYVKFRLEGENLLAGVNVLEIDVFNGGNPQDASSEQGIMACAIPWEGWAMRLWDPAEKTKTSTSKPSDETTNRND